MRVEILLNKIIRNMQINENYIKCVVYSNIRLESTEKGIFMFRVHFKND